MPRCADRHSVRRCGQSLGLPHINTVTVVHKFPTVIAYRIPRWIAFHENLEEIQNVCIACRQAVLATGHHVSGQQALKQDNRLSHQLRQYRKAAALADSRLPQAQALIDCRKYRCQVFCVFHIFIYYHIFTFTLQRYAGDPIRSPPAQSTAMRATKSWHYNPAISGESATLPKPGHHCGCPAQQARMKHGCHPDHTYSARFAIPSTTRYFQP